MDIGGLMHVLIPKHTSIPCKKIQLFTTYVDNQQTISCYLYEGEKKELQIIIV